jgi:NADPH-dependent 2,4-dienoyl-CoA reductase/sulfur reductase-like enzyme
VPFKPRIPGIDHANVLVLRTHQDQELIKRHLDSGAIKHLVILGSGFIGSEVAASLKQKYQDDL